MPRNYISSVRLNSPVDKSSYLHGLPAVRHLAQEEELAFSGPVTFLVGENGTGKSTLLEAIAVAYGFNAEGGTRNFSFATSTTHSDLYRHLTLVKSAYPKDGFFLRAESFYNAASYIDELDSIPTSSPPILASYGGKSLHNQSHGESFLALVKNRFGGDGIYLLDEPEAALSPTRLMTLMAYIHALVQKNSQFIIATHSPILMTYPGAQVYELSGAGIALVDYRKTEHYQLTRRFLENPEKMLHYLLDE
ncbi:MAG TPA: AAA family ATPase [Clostridia bacterium]|nr:AAA family ATPase [Clostridia bacterium]